MSRLHTQSLLELIPLFDQGRREILGFDGVRLRGVPAWELQDRLALSDTEREDWVSTTGTACYFPADGGDTHVSVDIEAGDDVDSYRYRCPVTFKLVDVSAADVAVLTVADDRFLHLVAELLGIPKALRSGIDKPLADGTLWHLGKARIDRVHIDCWIARDTASSLATVIEHLADPKLPDQGIVLLTTPALSPLAQPPRNYRFIPLADTLSRDIEAPRIDIDMLRRMLQAPQGTSLRPALAIDLNEIMRTLTIRGITEPWHIRGDRQWTAVKYIHDEFLAERTVLKPEDVLNAVYGNRTQGHSQTLASLFRGSRWKEFLEQPRKGEIRFAGL